MPRSGVLENVTQYRRSASEMRTQIGLPQVVDLNNRNSATANKTADETRRRWRLAVTKQVEQLDRVDHPVRRRLRRRHAAHRRPVHPGDRRFGNDLSTLPELPGRDPRPRRHPARRLVVPAALRRPRHPDARRRARRAGRDEPGGAAGQRHATCPRARRSSSTPTTSPAATSTKAGYADNPLEDGSLDDYSVHAVDLTALTVEAVKEFGLSRKDAARAKNMFSLGLLSWLYGRPIESTERVPRASGSPASLRSATPTSRRSRPAGTSARRPRRSRSPTRSSPPRCGPGTYRNISGNLALSYGLVAASRALRAAALPRRLPDHPGLATSCTSSASTSGSAS